jgi:hypothetical protein
MDKVTDQLDWKKDEQVPDQYTGPVQEPLIQSDLVSKSQVNQYKQQKKAQINTVIRPQPIPTSQNPSNPHLFPFIFVLFGILLLGVTGIYIGSQIVTAASATTTAVTPTSESEVLGVYTLATALAKVLIMVSVAAMLFAILQKCGLIPRTP